MTNRCSRATSPKCDPGVSRRGFVRALAAASGVIWLGSARSEPDRKLPKAQVLYQDTPAANGDRCESCTFFVAPGACKIVEGSVKPEGWCKRYEAGI